MENSTSDSSYRVLFVTRNDPTSVFSGGDTRAGAVSRALESCGEVEILQLRTEGSHSSPSGKPSLALGLRRIFIELLRGVLGGRFAPLDRVLFRHNKVASAVLEDSNILWFFKMQSVLGFGPGYRKLRSIPIIVDFDDLDDAKIAMAPVSGFAQSCSRAALVYSRKKVRHRIQALATVSVFCHSGDAERSLAPLAAVVSNTLPAAPSLQPEDGRDIAIIGNFLQGANYDGTSWFLNEVLPFLRAGGWTGELRMLGRSDGVSLQMPGVVWFGWQADLGAALRGCRMVVAPIRFGSGTSLKVLEGLCRGLPVVSTSCGVRGLVVSSGRNCIVEDSAELFASACLSLLSDDQLAAQIGAQGRLFWERRFSPAILETQVRAVLNLVS